MKRLATLLVVLTVITSCKVNNMPVEADLAPNPAAYVKQTKGSTFANFHGLHVDAETVKLEGEGMLFTVQKVELPPNKRSLNKIKNAYLPNGDVYQYSDLSLPSPHFILLGGEAISKDYATTELLFAVPAPDSNMYAITVLSTFMMDFEKAGKLVQHIVEKGIPSEVMTDRSAAVVDFVGRELQLGNVCEWNVPHEISCKGLGELKWSLHKSLEDATMARQIDMAITEAQSHAFLGSDEKWLVFEGQRVKATKGVYYKESGGQQRQIVYYISTGLRGQNVFCRISFTEDQIAKNELSPLAAKLIAL